ncbi:MAG: TadE/TadG family type IV pilus assembly protein [Pseudolabrys sp.]
MPEPRSKKSGFIRRLLPSRLVRRFVRQQDGSAAVEFGMVAVTFLGLTFAILETALVFFAGQTLETAVTDSARLIMTGQAQTGGWSKEDFKNAVCTQVYGLFDCAVQMYVDVKTYTSFAAITQTPPVTNGQLAPSKVSYSPGGVGDIEVVTLYYAWPIYISLLGNNLADIAFSWRQRSSVTNPINEAPRYESNVVAFPASLRPQPARRFRYRIRAYRAADAWALHWLRRDFRRCGRPKGHADRGHACEPYVAGHDPYDRRHSGQDLLPENRCHRHSASDMG